MSKKTAARTTGKDDASHDQNCSGSHAAEDLDTLPKVRKYRTSILLDGADDERKLMRALGIRNRDAMRELVLQLSSVCGEGDEAAERKLNLMLNFIADAKPRDQIESFLLAQMAVTHVISMQYASLMVTSEVIMQLDSNDRVFGKALKAYVLQMEALKRHRTLDAQPPGVPREQNQEPRPLAITHIRENPIALLQKADVEIVSRPSPPRDVSS